MDFVIGTYATNGGVADLVLWDSRTEAWTNLGGNTLVKDGTYIHRTWTVSDKVQFMVGTKVGTSDQYLWKCVDGVWTELADCVVSVDSIFATSEDSCWVTGSNLIQFWNGSTLTTQHTATPGISPYISHMYGIHGSSADDVWVCGAYWYSAGDIGAWAAHWDGASWTETLPDFNGVGIYDEANYGYRVWVASDGVAWWFFPETLYRYKNGAWEDVTSEFGYTGTAGAVITGASGLGTGFVVSAPQANNICTGQPSTLVVSDGAGEFRKTHTHLSLDMGAVFAVSKSRVYGWGYAAASGSNANKFRRWDGALSGSVEEWTELTPPAGTYMSFANDGNGVFLPGAGLALTGIGLEFGSTGRQKKLGSGRRM